MRINWKETISINKYAWMFLNILIYILLALAIYSFISDDQRQKSTDKNLDQLMQESNLHTEQQNRASEERKRINEQLERLEKEKTK